MKIISLFDGISGLQEALKNLNIPVSSYFASEVDKYAIQITQKNFPKTVQLGDIKDIKYFEIQDRDDNTEVYLHNDKPTIDLLSFGSPCQDLSGAKKDREGLSGARSGLFYEALRILREVKPRFFLMENVASMSKEAKAEISKELGVEPIMICSSKLTGQMRKRLYWVGKLQDNGTYKQVQISQPEDEGILLKDILENGLTYQEKSYTITASYDKAVFWNTIERKQRSMILEPINTPVRLGHFNKGAHADRIYSIEGKSVRLSSDSAFQNMHKIDLPDGDYRARKLTPLECERLQGFSPNFTEGIANSNRYKCLGNAFTVPVIEHILSHLFKNNL